MNEQKLLEEKLNQPDSILEPNVQEQMQQYLKLGGAPKNLVLMLADNYKGFPLMCEKLFWLAEKHVGLNGRTKLINDILFKLLLSNFNPTDLDEKLNQDCSWIEFWISNQDLRKVVYSLTKKYPQSKFIKIAIDKIIEKGYLKELALVSTLMALKLDIFVKVFFDYFEHLLQNSSKKSIFDPEIENLDTQIELLEQLVSLDPARYFWFLNFFNYLIRTKKLETRIELGLISVLRLIETRVAKKNNNSNFVRALNCYFKPSSHTLNDSIKAIISSPKNPPLGDIIILYELYKSENPPSIQHISNEEILDIFMSNAFSSAEKTAFNNNNAPRRSNSMDDKSGEFESIHKLLWLISYATSVIEDHTTGEIKNKDGIDAVFEELKNLYKETLFKPTLTGMIKFVQYIEPKIEIPQISCALIYWTKSVMLDSSYYDVYFKTDEIPITHMILEQIAKQQPLQRPIILKIFINVLSNPPQIAAETSIALRKVVIKDIIFLFTLGYSIPFLEYLNKAMVDMDEALIVFAIKEICDIIAPPYSYEFSVLFVKIIKFYIEKVSNVTRNYQLGNRFYITYKSFLDPISYIELVDDAPIKIAKSFFSLLNHDELRS